MSGSAAGRPIAVIVPAHNEARAIAAGAAGSAGALSPALRESASASSCGGGALEELAEPAPPAEGEVAPAPAQTPAEPASAGSGEAEAPVRILDHRGHLRTLEEIERDLIQLAIEIYSGHMTEVAKRLGIGRSTLYRKVREQGLEGFISEAS